MGGAEESDIDLSTSKIIALIELFIREGLGSSLVRELRSRLWSNLVASAKRPGVESLMATPRFK